MIDLHVHLRGTITPTMARKLAERNSVHLDVASWAEKGYGWHDFTSFLSAYDHIASLIVTTRDLEEVAYDYLARSAQLGATYVEFMLSPPDLMRVGVAFDDQLAALSSARDRALEEYGIDCRMIATAVRHLGPASAIQAATIAASRRDDILVGFGLTGDERMFVASEFKEAFRIARSEDLRATAHAGEHLGPDTIIDAIEVLGLERVGHGIRAVESESVTRQLASAKVPLEVCLTSNLALNLYPSIDEHPVSQLAAAGCVVVLGTDDPAFFSTDIEQEYRLAANVGLLAGDITEQAKAASFK
ncbi:adenosine deaminase [Segnochrobactrum spirostomi]|uniref:Adenosine deaminase n=1 Tax=Segnochrobactrum spirostomi TaxID=2608987 RepID=A0A6A7XX93_9HYPH|nr:adenosine deaminase [Segnochrobactrum spirostomi]MQT11184.1 adenosine deaminase [Segnochrobactrum spirostomi]